MATATARPPMSPGQRRIFKLIVRRFGEQMRFPTYKEIAAELGIAGPNAVFTAVHALMKKGYIVRDDGTGKQAARSLRIPELQKAVRDAARELLRNIPEG